MAKKFIVKVQASQMTTAATAQVLVYNESRSIFYQGDMPAEVLSELKGRPKAFFLAQRNGKGQVELIDDAPWQEW